MKMTNWLALGLATLVPASGIVATSADAQGGTTAARPLLTKPILYMRSMERYMVGAQKFVRFNYEVTNKSAYSAGLFTHTNTLPPCGANANASRTWVDFYNTNTNARIYGFCALNGPNDLDHLWFALPEGTAPPRSVYIVIKDRQTGAYGRSNNEVTVLTPPPSG